MRRARIILGVAIAALLGCGAEPRNGRAVEITPPADSSQPASAPRPSPSTAAPASAGPPDEHACVMLYECGCNASCTEIELAASALRGGIETKVRSGSLQGTRVFVKNSTSASGREVFTVQRSDPNAVGEVCRSLAVAPLLGYACAASDLGPPRACSSCQARP